MNRVTTLPADSYIVLNKTILNIGDRKLITMLYQPIIGYAAVSLYFTLIDDLDKRELMSEELNHHHLMATMQLRLEDIVIAREKLEAVGLLKSYLKNESINNYVYCLFSPISAGEFFTHPILNVVLYNNLGKKEYEKVINVFRTPKVNLSDYADVTMSFNKVFKSVSSDIDIINTDISKRDSLNINIDNIIDFDLLISSIPKNMFNDRCFSREVRELINSLGYIYNLDTMQIKGIVYDSINEKGYIDKTLLRKRCRDYYQFENNQQLPTVIYHKQPTYLKSPVGSEDKKAKMIYMFENITPYQLLKTKYKGGEPTDRDKRLVEGLLIDQKLKPGVVNVLLSYIMSINNQQLTKSYVETLAGQWKRLNIETVEEAMAITEKSHKKVKRNIPKKTNISVKKEVVPSWFDEKLDTSETSESDSMELDKLLSELA